MVPPPRKAVVAPFGKLTPGAAADVQLFQEFFALRDRVFAQMLGRRAKRSPLREELLRHILTQYVAGRTCPISAYQRLSTYHAAWSAVRTEIDMLEYAGLVVLSRSEKDRRETHVFPTQKAIEFYNVEMPKLADAMASLFAKRAGRQDTE